MAATPLQIEAFLELAGSHPVFDVRSPGEFIHAHIPNAYSLPLFTDEERKQVGTAYKQESREKAIKIGLDFFGPKMRTMVEEVETILKKNSDDNVSSSKTILVHCWRGGMRSSAVAWLLDLYGYKVFTLIGGYKRFRNYVLDTFNLPVELTLLGGYTGSGKTAILATLKENGYPVVCLESLAKHKGSAFGNIERIPQPTQEMFENLLALELRKLYSEKKSPVWVEDESQRIGLVNIPPAFWKTMRKSPVQFLDIPFNARLEYITREYGSLDPEKLVEAIGRISEKLGHLNAKTAILLLKEGKISESFEILLKYYDKHYLKALHNREGVNSLLNTVNSNTVTPENARLLSSQNCPVSQPVPEDRS